MATVTPQELEKIKRLAQTKRITEIALSIGRSHAVTRGILIAHGIKAYKPKAQRPQKWTPKPKTKIPKNIFNPFSYECWITGKKIDN